MVKYQFVYNLETKEVLKEPREYYDKPHVCYEKYDKGSTVQVGDFDPHCVRITPENWNAFLGIVKEHKLEKKDLEAVIDLALNRARLNDKQKINLVEGIETGVIPYLK